MIDRFKPWFTERSPREKWLLAAMVALAFLTLVWALIILPVTDGLSAARARHSDAVARLAETQARVAELAVLQHARPAPIAGSLDAVIRDRANDAGFALTSVNAGSADSVQISIATARPGALFGWVAGLEASGIIVDSLSTTDNGDRTVAAQISFRAQAR
jgi:general secretion pathway protein M